MARWYYSVAGKAEGPEEQDFIVSNLRSGKLTLVDLVFKEGGDDWQTISEISEFKDILSQNPLPPPQAQSQKPIKILEPTQSWVVLKKILHQHESRFVQEGPYSAAQIIDHLASGAVNYNDYVWKPGFKRWVRIGNLTEFDRRSQERERDMIPDIIPTPEFEMVLPPISQTELMKNVTTLERKSVFTQQDLPPKEAVGPDLTDELKTTIQIPEEQKTIIQPVPEAKTTIEPMESKTVIQPFPEFTSQPERTAKSSRKVKPPVDRDDQVTVIQADPLPSEPPPRAMDQSKSKIKALKKPVYPETFEEEDQAPTGLRPASTGSYNNSEFRNNSMNYPAQEPFKRSIGRLWRWAIATVMGSVAIIAALMIMYPRGEHTPPVATETKESKGQAPVATIPKAPPPPKNIPAPPVAVEPAPRPPVEGHAAVDPNLKESTSAGLESVANMNSDGPSDDGEDALPAPHGPLPTGPVTLKGIKAMKLTSLKPLLVFEGNVPVKARIMVSIKARSGEILRLPSFSKQAAVVRKAGELPSLNLSSWNLPPGSYHIEASGGESRVVKNVFIGVKDRKFEAELERHHKIISYQQQSERKAVFYSAKGMEELAKNLDDNYQRLKGTRDQWQKFLQTWAKNVATAQTPMLASLREDKRFLAYPDELYALRSALVQLKGQAKLYDALIAGKRDIASKSGHPNLSKEFERLKVVASGLTNEKH